ncbi:MAG: 6,7-dimethyl-8-ribityllumazine synthase [Verrucomicrobiota bacterium]
MKSSGVVQIPQEVEGKVSIVASLFNKEYVDALIDSATKVLGNHNVTVERVPGSFEIPLAVKKVIKKQSPAVVIAFGLIWEGKTVHAELVANSVTNELMRLSVDFEIPILHQVLLVKDEEQAMERCFGNDLNRGREAAEAAKYLLESVLDKHSKGL